MKANVCLTVVAATCAMFGCGEVEPVGDASMASDASAVVDADIVAVDAPQQLSDASLADAGSPDASVCTSNDECSNNVFCDGVEICGTEGMCEPGSPADCGTTDSCTTRYCDTASDTCAVEPIVYTIDYSYTGTGGSAGTVTLECGQEKTTQILSGNCPTGAPLQIRLNCSMNDSGGLTARTRSSNLCVSDSQGSTVTSGCSIIGAGGPGFSCCF